MKQRAELFRYVSLEIDESTLLATYELDGRRFVESVTYDDILLEDNPAVTALAGLWFLLAGLSYYKAGAARRIDFGNTPIGPKGRALLEAALHEGLGEFAYRNDLPLNDVTIVGGTELVGVNGHSRRPTRTRTLWRRHRLGRHDVAALTPARPGPIRRESAARAIRPPGGDGCRHRPRRFVRATRSLDPQILSPEPRSFRATCP